MPEKQKKNSISINKYKTKRELNIGTLIFALIFILSGRCGGGVCHRETDHGV